MVAADYVHATGKLVGGRLVFGRNEQMATRSRYGAHIGHYEGHIGPVHRGAHIALSQGP